MRQKHLAMAQDDNGIAVVMGHEIAHALARHGAERMSQTMGAQAIGELLAAGVGQVSPGMRDDFLKVYGLPLLASCSLGAELKNPKPIELA